jgi:hypothetical protein
MKNKANKILIYDIKITEKYKNDFIAYYHAVDKFCKKYNIDKSEYYFYL